LLPSVGNTLAPAPDTVDVAARRARLPSLVGNESYQFLGQIGEGRHKRVYLAWDRELKCEVALALIKAQAFDELGSARVWGEIETIARLSGHDNTVSFYDSGEDHYGRPYLVTEHMKGGDLSARRDGPLALAEVLRIAAGLASALAHVHEHGIVHRDVKPENLWFGAEGALKLGDFGLSLPAGERQPGNPNAIEGTAAYLSPEQARGAPADARADLYSLGAVIYDVLCGRPPFINDDPAALVMAHLRAAPKPPSRWRADVPRSLDVLILSLLEKAPENRPGTATDVLHALAAVRPRWRVVTAMRGLRPRG
jgi:serine/threonine protein kinase